jgi:hypothetical protein
VSFANEFQPVGLEGVEIIARPLLDRGPAKIECGRSRPWSSARRLHDRGSRMPRSRHEPQRETYPKFNPQRRAEASTLFLDINLRIAARNLPKILSSVVFSYYLILFGRTKRDYRSRQSFPWFLEAEVGMLVVETIVLAVGARKPVSRPQDICVGLTTPGHPLPTAAMSWRL